MNKYWDQFDAANRDNFRWQHKGAFTIDFPEESFERLKIIRKVHARKSQDFANLAKTCDREWVRTIRAIQKDHISYVKAMTLLYEDLYNGKKVVYPKELFEHLVSGLLRLEFGFYPFDTEYLAEENKAPLP